MSLISIKNLTISFKKNQNVVNMVNIEIPKGKTVAIVGESGSGKTLSALSILKLLPVNANINSGSIIFKDKDILQLIIDSDNLQKAAEKLVNVAVENGGYDNISVVLMGLN